MGGAVTLRRATVKDAAAYARLMGDPAVYPGTAQLPFADEERHRAWLADLSTPGKTDLVLVAEVAGEVVGNASLHPAGTSLRRRHAVSLGIAVLPEAQGQGVGSALMAALCDYSDGWLGALRIELTVFSDNARAIGLYRKFGFVVEGTLRGYALRDGQFADVLTMARWHPRPPAI